MKKNSSMIIGTAITIFLLWISFRQVQWVDLAGYLRQANYFLVLMAATLYLLSYAVRAFLWKELLGQDVPLGVNRLFQHLLLGVMANNLLPARLGEVVRSCLSARDANVSTAKVFSSIFVERSLDVLWLFGFTTIAFVQDFQESWPTNVAYLAFVLIILIVVFLCAIIQSGQDVIQFIVRVSPGPIRGRIHKWLDHFVISFLEGLPPRGLNHRNLSIMAYSMGCWLVWVGFLYVSLKAFAITLPLPGIIMLTGIINLGVLIPSAPGFIGPFQFICLVGLGLFGVLPEKALAFSIVFHASWYLPSTILGVVFFLKSRMWPKVGIGTTAQ